MSRHTLHRCRSSDLWFLALVAALCVLNTIKVLRLAGLAPTALDDKKYQNAEPVVANEAAATQAIDTEYAKLEQDTEQASSQRQKQARMQIDAVRYHELAACSDPSQWAKDDDRHLAWVACSRRCIVDRDIPHLTFDQTPNLLFEVCACACMQENDAATRSANTSIAKSSSLSAFRNKQDTVSSSPLDLNFRCPMEAHDFREILRDTTRLAKTFYVGGRSMPAWKSAALLKGLAPLSASKKRTADFYHDYSKVNFKKATWADTAWHAPQHALQYWNSDSMGFHDKAKFAECTRGLDLVIPATFRLPEETQELTRFDHRMRNKRQSESIDPKSGRESWREEEPLSWVFKPAVGSGGYGVQRVDSTGKLTTMGKGIAQAYIPSYLLDGRKFDLRLYVLVTSLDPLRAYLHTDGMVRLAYSAHGEGEKQSANGNKTNCTFITNISQRKNCVEKNSKEAEHVLRDRHAVKSRYVWRIPALKEYVEDNPRHGIDFDDVWHDIEVAVAQTLLACKIRQCVSFRDLGDSGARSYFVLGFDIAVDTQLRVWVMEVNQRPDDNSSVGPHGMFPDSPYLQGRPMQKFALASLDLLGLPAFDRRGYGCDVLRLMSAYCRERGRLGSSGTESSSDLVEGHSKAAIGCTIEEQRVLLRAADEYMQLEDSIMHQVLPLRPSTSSFQKVASQLPTNLWQEYQSLPSTQLLQPWLKVLAEATGAA